MKESAHSSTFLRLKQTFKKYLRSKVIILQRLYQMGGVKDVNICYFLRFFTKLSALHTNKLAKKACPRFGEHAFSAWGYRTFFRSCQVGLFRMVTFRMVTKKRRHTRKGTPPFGIEISRRKGYSLSSFSLLILS